MDVNYIGAVNCVHAALPHMKYSEGKIIKECGKYPKKVEIVNALGEFCGNIEQFPHKYSSIKINGQRACQQHITCYFLTVWRYQK